jgi:DHA3 family macrolide efflux protein-like MFS transporter
VIGIVLLALLAIPTLPRTGDPLGYTDDLRTGRRYARDHSAVRWILVSLAVVFLLVVPPSYLTPLMIVRTFGPMADVVSVEALLMAGGLLTVVVGVVIRSAAPAFEGAQSPS